MAWAEWKEVLLPGRQRDRYGDWFTFTPRDIRAAYRNVGLMLSRGVPLPCVWEHVKVEANSPDDVKAKYAKHTFGHIAGRRINSRGALELLHEGRDPKDREQLLKTRFVSPKVCPGYSDSKGGEYRGATIAHVAATPTPVQFWQRPFGAELSRRRSLYLSYQPGGDAMADDADTKPKKGDGEGEGENAELSELIEALRAKGMNISDKVTTLRELTIAVESAGDVDDDELGLDGEGGGDGDTTQTGGGAPMLMSEDRAKPFRKSARREAVGRIKALFSSGRVTRDAAKKKLREAGTAELSITRDGDVAPNRLFAWIEAMEDVPAWSAWKRTGRDDSRDLSVTELDPPEQLTKGTADKEATDFLLGPSREAKK